MASTRIDISVATGGLLQRLKDLRTGTRAESAISNALQKSASKTATDATAPALGRTPTTALRDELTGARGARRVLHLPVLEVTQNRQEGTVSFLGNTNDNSNGVPQSNAPFSVSAPHLVPQTQFQIWSGNQQSSVTADFITPPLPVSSDTPNKYTAGFSSYTGIATAFQPSTLSYLQLVELPTELNPLLVEQGYVPIENRTLTRTVTAWSAKSSAPSYTTSQQILVLPAGNRTCILLILFRRAAVLQTRSAAGLYSVVDTGTQTRWDAAFSSLTYYSASLTSPPYENVYFYVLPTPVDASLPGITPGPITVTRSFDRSQKAYLCSDTRIREIGIPAALQNFIDIISPPQEIAGTGNFPNANFVAAVADYGDLSVGMTAAVGINQFYTPSIYQAINATAEALGEAPIIPTTLVRAFPSDTKRVLLGDIRSGYYSDLYSNSPSPALTDFRYAEWVGSTVNPDYTQTQFYFSVPSLRQTTAVGTPALPQGVTPYAVWDWDSPGYCRAVCQSLGFTPADLKP